MKKINLFGVLILTLIVTSVLWLACDKEKIATDSNSSDQKLHFSFFDGDDTDFSSIESIPCTTYYSQIQSVNGMLSFLNVNHFEAVILCLERDVDVHNDAFEAIYGSYSDEEIEKLTDTLNFNEDQPLVDLESGLGFNSLRKHIEDKMDVWLNNAVLNMATNPDYHIILDEETRTLLTPDCKAIIAGQVVDFCDPGSGNSMTSDSDEKSMLGFCALNNSDCCWWGRRQRELKYDNDTKKIVVTVALRNKLGWPAKVKGKVKSLRKDGNKWKRFRTPLRIIAGGQVFDNNNCEGGVPATKEKPEEMGATLRRSKLRVSRNELGVTWRSMDNFIRATGFAGSNQLTFQTAFLTF